ncbi:DUF6090 family protein [Croceitalea rosinachiae]|uniref:DUF6090 family protein n=1 Tax=Croceitalea rosinachiae TaxID=3075596 RepID=A0ABU3A746_9FLAO|nr:DUF6090 family protein [Croceitalea sp. F388]MDT0605991.1 DUF6090 family protein [Croceitalea sp. F388]
MLLENNFSKYLLYAIGEIVLVVIGILIALQINNYSEHQKERQKERILLGNLVNDVALDILQIENNTNLSRERLGRLDSLVQQLKSPDSVRSLQFIRQSYEFVVDQYFKSNSGIFDEAVSSGHMSYIQNESLRQNVFNYYRNAKETYTDGTTRQITDEFITPLLVEHVYLHQEGLEMLEMNMSAVSPLKKMDLRQLANNKDYWKMVLLKFGSNQEQMIRWGGIKQRAVQLKQEIDQELERLEQ